MNLGSAHRRAVLAAVAALPFAATASRARAQVQAQGRPALAARRFSSPAVEATIDRVRPKIQDRRLAAMFEVCFPNTLDTTVEVDEVDGKPDTFVITGDIPCMWLRDSSAQVWPYLPLMAQDPALRRMVEGVIRRQARCILIDPYANAFLKDPQARTDLKWALHDLTEMKPGVAERKWEIDSLCWPLRLSYGYWRATADISPFDDLWRQAMRRVVATFREQQRLDGPGSYVFQRPTEIATETLMLAGYGAPTRKVGLIHSMFRPSDDACVLPFLIPANHFAVVALRQLARVSVAVPGDGGLAAECLALADQVAAALEAHGKIFDAQGRSTWAYECDGFGNGLFMDDANVPSLLALPYLDVCSARDALYRRTRTRALGASNPFFFAGTAAEGIGGPHAGLRMIWPMAIIMRALTSVEDGEILQSLTWLKTTDAGTGVMHEAFDQDDPTRFTRAWFAWANSLFGELILTLEARKPHLLRAGLPA